MPKITEGMYRHPPGVESTAAVEAARQIAVCLMYGQRQKAVEIIDCTLTAPCDTRTVEERLATPLGATDMDMRVLNKLENMSITTVAELLNTPQEELLRERRVGVSFVRECLRVCANLGFGGLPDEPST